MSIVPPGIMCRNVQAASTIRPHSFVMPLGVRSCILTHGNAINAVTISFVNSTERFFIKLQGGRFGRHLVPLPKLVYVITGVNIQESSSLWDARRQGTKFIARFIPCRWQEGSVTKESVSPQKSSLYTKSRDTSTECFKKDRNYYSKWILRWYL